jgi:Ca-activated chloride channel family protein
MMPALLAALADDPDDTLAEGAVRQVVFITDGAVGNEAALFEQIARHLGDQRLFTVGIGSAPNSWFMRKAAQFGRGTHTHIGRLDEVEARMGELLAQLARPAATNITVSWPTVVEAWPERPGDLYTGEPLLLAVKFGEQAPAGEVVVEADIGGQPWRQVLQVAPAGDPVHRAGHAGVASVWARKKIAGLLDTLAQGQPADAVRDAVLPLALEHQLMSPYTSFVAIEEVISRPAEEALHSAAVPNARPAGQSPQPFAFAQTATTGPAKLWLGTLCLFMALLLRVVRQAEVDHVPA